MIAPVRMVIDLVERYLVPQLLGDERERGARAHAHAEREVSGRPAHGDHEVPAPRGLRVLHEVLDELRAELARGLEPEGRDAMRQRQVVVDGLRHVTDGDLPARLLLHAGRGVGRIVAADGHEVLDAQGRQGLDDVGHLFGALGRVLARCADDGAAAHVDARDFVGMEVHDVRRVALGQPLEPVADADHFKTLFPGLEGDRADHAVDPRGRSSAYNHRKLFRHSRLLLLFKIVLLEP